MTGPATEADRAALPFREVEAFAYRFPVWQTHGHPEDCADFLLSVRAKLPAIVERYEDRGRPFVAYLSACLRWEWLSYCRRRWRTEDEQANEPQLAAVASGYMNAEPPDYEPAGWDVRTIDHATQRRRIVAAAVKAACEIDDSQVAVIAQSVERPDLQALIDRARQMVAPKAERADRIRERMRRNLARRLVGHDANPATYTNAARDLRAARLAPSNRQVADLLGEPKGTVDGWLAQLQRQGVAA